MSTYASGPQKSGRTSTSSNSTHFSKQDALSDREFELLLEGAYDMDDDFFELEAKFVILVAGRLGLRAGEIAHMRENWIDWRRRMVVIPGYQECEKGRGGGHCGQCEQAAKQKVEHNDDITLEGARRESWTPKTDAAAREVPFDASPRAELAIERYFDRFDRFQTSQTGLGRRVKTAAGNALELEPEDVKPHGLRATAATRFAARGLNVIALQAMFGWSQLSTAHHYIRRSGENTARAIRDIQV